MVLEQQDQQSASTDPRQVVVTLAFVCFCIRVAPRVKLATGVKIGGIDDRWGEVVTGNLCGREAGRGYSKQRSDGERTCCYRSTIVIKCAQYGYLLTTSASRHFLQLSG